MRVCDPVSEELDDEGLKAHSCAQIQVGMHLRVFLGPIQREAGKEDNDAYLEGEDCVEHIVHKKHKVTDLPRGLLRVTHDFRISAYVYSDAVTIFTVL